MRFNNDEVRIHVSNKQQLSMRGRERERERARDKNKYIRSVTTKQKALLIDCQCKHNVLDVLFCLARQQYLLIELTTRRCQEITLG